MKRLLMHEERTLFPARGAAWAKGWQGNTAGKSTISVAGGRRRGRQMGEERLARTVQKVSLFPSSFFLQKCPSSVHLSITIS